MCVSVCLCYGPMRANGYKKSSSDQTCARFNTRTCTRTSLFSTLFSLSSLSNLTLNLLLLAIHEACKHNEWSSSSSSKWLLTLLNEIGDTRLLVSLTFTLKLSSCVACAWSIRLLPLYVNVNNAHASGRIFTFNSLIYYFYLPTNTWPLIVCSQHTLNCVQVYKQD